MVWNYVHCESKRKSHIEYACGNAAWTSVNQLLLFLVSFLDDFLNTFPTIGGPPRDVLDAAWAQGQPELRGQERPHPHAHVRPGGQGERGWGAFLICNWWNVNDMVVKFLKREFYGWVQICSWWNVNDMVGFLKWTFETWMVWLCFLYAIGETWTMCLSFCSCFTQTIHSGSGQTRQWHRPTHQSRLHPSACCLPFRSDQHGQIPAGTWS